MQTVIQSVKLPITDLSPLGQWSPGAQLIETEATVNFRNLLECADNEIGPGPFTLTAFHGGVDGLTIDWIEVGCKPKKREV